MIDEAASSDSSAGTPPVDRDRAETSTEPLLPAPLGRWLPSARPLGLLLFGLLALPFLIALWSLSRKRWYPVLDMAMTELRVRDVGTSHTPLIGLPGRIGELPDVGSHPGPLSFWVLGPVYRLLGQTAYSLEVGTVLVQLAVIAVLLLCGYHLAGRVGMLFVAVVVAIVIRGYGMVLLTTPWNPYFPLLAWLLVLLATVAVLVGHSRWIIAVVAAGTFCAQTHVPYLLLCVAMFVLAAGVLLWRAWFQSDVARRDGDVAGDDVAGDGAWGSGRHLRPLGIAVGVGVLLWLAPIVEELRGGEGNITRLRDHFTSPPEDTAGYRTAFSTLLRHLNVWEGFAKLVADSGRFVSVGLEDQTARWPGVIVLVLWAACAVAAVIVGSRRLIALHSVIALGLVLSLFSISRIFGTLWFYLMLWAWSIATLMLVSIVATAAAVARRWRPAEGMGISRAVVAAGAALVFGSAVVISVDAADTAHHEQERGERFEPLVEPTYQAVVDGVGAAQGPDGTYVIRMSDAQFIHSHAYGLLSELDRMGLDVGMDPYFGATATEHRTVPHPPLDPSDPDGTVDPFRTTATAEIRYASGAYIDDFREQPEAVEVVSFDPLADPEIAAEYAEQRQVLLDELERQGLLDDLAERVDRNLFALTEDLRLSRTARGSTAHLLSLGTEVAVFIIPVDGPAD